MLPTMLTTEVIELFDQGRRRSKILPVNPH